MLNYLCQLPVNESEKHEFESICPKDHEIVFFRGLPQKELLPQTEAVIGNLPISMLQKAPHLRWIQLQSAGIDGYQDPDTLPNHAVLTNASGCYGPAIAEHMLAMLLSISKNMLLYYDHQKDGLWKPEGTVKGLSELTVLIVGMGDIGSCFGMRMHLLGSKVWGIRRVARACPEWADKILPMDELDDALTQADVVALSLPSTPATYKLFDRDRLQKIKKGAILLNVGRGNVLDTDALVELLNSGDLGGAGLDVTDPEPLPAGHPLYNARNTLITPHVSGGYHMEETRKRIVNLALENFRRFVNGEELTNQVDFKAGYRKTVE